MASMIGPWSHGIAALLFAALAVWQLRHWRGEPRNRPLVIAFAAMSAWSIFNALLGPGHALSLLGESIRNLTFLAFMYGIIRSAADDERQRAVRIVCMTVAAVVGVQLAVSGLQFQFAREPLVHEALASTASVLGMTIAAGSLVLVHNLYGQAAPDARWGIRMPMIALAAMWGYDLHLHTVAYFTRGSAAELFAMRGAIDAMLAPLFALASQRNREWKVQLSRAATFQSLSVLAILCYLVLMMSATRAVEIVGGDWVSLGQIGLVFAITIAAAVLLPSGRARAWLRVMVTKHFFEHRYDYREEWLRFTRTIGLGGEDAAPLEERVVKALADIADAPGGLLLAADERYLLTPSARWNWRATIGTASLEDAPFARFLEERSIIIDFGAIADGRIHHDGQWVAVPAWLTRVDDAWAGIPLVHNDKLVGLVILPHPLMRRPLDWEDFDLFRNAGIQAASYLAEARGQEALADAHRFDEFNRRFAFIMHDIKNLVSQLALVAHNAERHAHNPEFRADMVATLQSSVKKMNDLLARLSRGRGGEAEPPRPISLSSVTAGIARAKGRAHPIETFGEAGLCALADPVRLEEAVGHVVQNAIDVSAPGVPVRLCLRRQGGEVMIDVIDAGAGMSGEFVRTRLFQPFASTKEGGFGIGAYEARALIAGMGGRLEVESREGEGSRFTIILPAGAMDAPLEIERMRA